MRSIRAEVAPVEPAPVPVKRKSAPKDAFGASKVRATRGGALLEPVSVPEGSVTISIEEWARLQLRQRCGDLCGGGDDACTGKLLLTHISQSRRGGRIEMLMGCQKCRTEWTVASSAKLPRVTFKEFRDTGKFASVRGFAHGNVLDVFISVVCNHTYGTYRLQKALEDEVPVSYGTYYAILPHIYAAFKKVGEGYIATQVTLHHTHVQCITVCVVAGGDHACPRLL